LEVDRRRLMRRMTKLETQLVRLSSTRRTQRKARGRSRLKTISLVGYTNAGKSTLLNALTGAGVLVADRLFATLDPRTRRLLLPNGDTALCSDTVGFIRKLPHQLVESFRSTLEVVGESDLLVHVVDATAAEPFAQMDAVRSVLKEIGAGEVAELVVFNKADCTPEAARLAASVPGSVAISASTGEGIGELLDSVADRLRTHDLVVELVVPFDRGDVLAALHREGEILAQDQIEAGIRLHVVLARDGVQRYAQFVPDRQTS
jgi:GTP-binding protein HflX